MKIKEQEGPEIEHPYQDTTPSEDIGPFENIYYCQPKLKFTSNGKVLYTVADKGIILDSQTKKSSYYAHINPSELKKDIRLADQNNIIVDEHKGNCITALDISVDRTFVVTGDAGYSPSIHIWEASSGEYVTSILLPVATYGV